MPSTARNIPVLCLLLVIAPALVTLSGCSRGDDKWVKGRPPVYKASGKVTYKGKPLEDALVLYQPTTGDTAARGKTDAEGKYVLSTFGENDGAPAGSYKVLVTKTEYIVKPTAYNSPEENAVAKIPKQLLPAKYAKKESTELTAEVTSAGPNEKVLEVND